MPEGQDQGSISRWIGVLRVAGASPSGPDPSDESVEQAARALWERFFQRMVGLARLKLRASKARDSAVDGEDVAISAFDSFYAGATRGHFPVLFDRDDLWRLLVVITSRKAMSETRRQNRQKRGAGLVRNESQVGPLDDDELLARALATEPTPDSAAMVVEEYRLLLDRLGDDTLRKVAVWRMEGYTNDEIADRLGCARRTVARQLALIRAIWQTQESDSP